MEIPLGYILRRRIPIRYSEQILTRMTEKIKNWYKLEINILSTQKNLQILPKRGFFVGIGIF
jgi:hypothetical protein